jgi:uncharacterized protein YcaQ
VLPVLHRDRFVARFEPRRTNGALLVKGWWWEPGLACDACRTAVRDAVEDFAAYLGVNRVEVTRAVGERERRMLGARRCASEEER